MSTPIALDDEGLKAARAVLPAAVDHYTEAAITAYLAAASPIHTGVKALEWRNVDSPDMASDEWWYEAYSPFGKAMSHE